MRAAFVLCGWIFTRRHATIRKTTGLPRREETYETAKDFFSQAHHRRCAVGHRHRHDGVIKESLDTQDPESALPIITVLYGDEELVPDKEVRRAGWEWNFFLTQEKTPLLSPEDVPLQPVDVMPGAQMRILFTKEPSELRVMRAVSDKPTEYLELSDAGGGRFSTPTTPGLYFYKVRAEWSGRGFIQYYFALQVRELQI